MLDIYSYVCQVMYHQLMYYRPWHTWGLCSELTHEIDTGWDRGVGGSAGGHRAQRWKNKKLELPWTYIHWVYIQDLFIGSTTDGIGGWAGRRSDIAHSDEKIKIEAPSGYIWPIYGQLQAQHDQNILQNCVHIGQKLGRIVPVKDNGWTDTMLST